MQDQQSPSIISTIVGNYSAMSAWPAPQSRNFAELSDPLIFAEVLEIAGEEGYISTEKLMSESEGLRKRLRSLWVIERPTKTTINGVISAMRNFGWLKESPAGYFRLSAEGEQIRKLSKENMKPFRRRLAEKMFQRYVIPGWMVARLLALNPHGQGEIVLPSPPKDWQPNIRPWEQHEWTAELESQATKAVDIANITFPGSFPVSQDIWIWHVKTIWNRLSEQTRRRVAKLRTDAKSLDEKPGVSTYAPRGRLSQAMREAAIELMFSAFELVSSSQTQLRLLKYSPQQLPIPPRAFGAWCPRLDALELMFYTDWHPLISGRLLFPCCAFREKADTPPFEVVSRIRNPKGNRLYLHQPTWEYIREDFISILLKTYERISYKVGALYLSLLDVRDEVCRQLRLSSTLFDSLLETYYRESIRENIDISERISISLESDIRPEQRTGYGMLRRPVYIGGVPHSLIAISRKYRS